MFKKWWNSGAEEEEPEDWQYSFGAEKPRRGPWKQALTAAVLFGVYYALHSAGAQVGEFADRGARFIVTQNTDFAYLWERSRAYLPQGVNEETLRRVQAALARPLDPLAYMSAPVDDEVAAVFGLKTDPATKKEVMQDGVEYRCAAGTNVKAASVGKVKTVSVNDKFGKYVIVEHGEDIETVYGYLAEAFVGEGDRVSQGQILGKSGRRNEAASDALYFALLEKGVPTDPLARVQGTYPKQQGR